LEERNTRERMATVVHTSQGLAAVTPGTLATTEPTLRRGPAGPRIGLVLGSGAARGWAHIGVIRALANAGVRPDIVCGTSVGALVGAAYAAGNLERFEDWALRMRFRDVISFLDVRLNGGLLNGTRLMSFIASLMDDTPIEELAMPFGAVATTLQTGAEVWLRTGSAYEAVRASLAMPGLFAPVQREDTLLVDGALVNPVPVSLARAMGADVVIAVDLSSNVLGRHVIVEAEPAGSPPSPSNEWMSRLRGNLSALWPAAHGPRRPSVLNVIASSLDIMLVRITRSRMAGEPPDVVVAPRLGHLGLFDFHRAEEAIKEGERAMTVALESLELFGVYGASLTVKPS
jgi:NTE family protein